MVLGGLVLILENYGVLGSIAIGWPLAVTLAGAALIVASIGRGAYGRGLRGVGAFLLLCSLLFMYLNLTGWSQIAFLWPLFVGFIGLSILAGAGRKVRDALLYLAIFLILLCVTFLLVFSVDPKMWPLALVVAGVTLFVIGRS